jgi:hypothetical protein
LQGFYFLTPKIFSVKRSFPAGQGSCKNVLPAARAARRISAVAKAKSFPQNVSIHSVNSLRFFHKLKTQWKVCKSLAAAPVFRVELNSFHRVFNSRFPHILAKALQFVKFKLEL